MRFLMLSVMVMAACACHLVSAATSGVVFIEYFHSPDCAHCEEATRHVAEIAARYAPMTTVLHHRLFSAADWAVLIEREQQFGVKIAGPLAVWVGSNALYGVETVVAGLEPLVVKSIAAGGVPPWRPPVADRARPVSKPAVAASNAVQPATEGWPRPARSLRSTVRAAFVIGLVVLATVLALWHLVRPRG